MATIDAVRTNAGLRPQTSPIRPNSKVPIKAPTNTMEIMKLLSLFVNCHSTCTEKDKKESNSISIASDAEHNPEATNIRC
mmetsp:Transcript_7157/g.11326  ORF Transcript_7157/g.11326 Transcript_7157/m.11326 type:complete len:80 (-) Transcript_7157:126-365(-)